MKDSQFGVSPVNYSDSDSGVCTREGCLKCQRMLVSATPSFWDKDIRKNSGFTLQTFIKQTEHCSFSFSGGFSHFDSARMTVMQPYMRYNNPSLLQLEERYTDVEIGSINIPYISAADDLAVISWRYGFQQIQIWDV